MSRIDCRQLLMYLDEASSLSGAMTPVHLRTAVFRDMSYLDLDSHSEKKTTEGTNNFETTPLHTRPHACA